MMNGRMMNDRRKLSGIWPVDVLATHRLPDLDELGTIWGLRRPGWADWKFPGIGEARMEIWPTGRTPDGRPWQSWLKQDRVLPIGVAGSVLDEHATASKRAKRDQCAFTLAMSLIGRLGGRNEDFILIPIVEEILLNDAEGKFSWLSSQVRKLNFLYPDNPERVLAVVSEILDSDYNLGLLKSDAPGDFSKTGQIVEIDGPERRVKMATVKSDLFVMREFVLWQHKPQIFIQCNSAGQTQIHAAKWIKLTGVVRRLRMLEQLHGGKTVVENEAVLERGGRAWPEDPWFFHEALNSLLNGSPKYPGIPATQIPFEIILKTTRDFLQYHPFERKKQLGSASRNRS